MHFYLSRVSVNLYLEALLKIFPFAIHNLICENLWGSYVYLSSTCSCAGLLFSNLPCKWYMIGILLGSFVLLVACQDLKVQHFLQSIHNSNNTAMIHIFCAHSVYRIYACLPIVKPSYFQSLCLDASIYSTCFFTAVPFPFSSPLDIILRFLVWLPAPPVNIVSITYISSYNVFERYKP